MALAHRPPPRRPRYVLDINYCNTTWASCQFPIIYKGGHHVSCVTMLQSPATNGNHHHHRRCGICLWPLASPRCYHSNSSWTWSPSLMSQMSFQRFFQREKMSVTMAFKCFKWFCNFTVCGLSFKFENLISVNYWINFILPTNCWTNGSLFVWGMNVRIIHLAKL